MAKGTILGPILDQNGTMKKSFLDSTGPGSRSSRPFWVPALEQSSGTQKRASNIDFCKTSLAIVKVLGGQGDHFGTNLGPKRHLPERSNGPGHPLVPDLGHKFCRRASNIDFCRTSHAIVKVLGCQGNHFGTNFGPKWHHEEVIFGLYRPTLATSSAERLQTSIFVGPSLQLSRFRVATGTILGPIWDQKGA